MPDKLDEVLEKLINEDFAEQEFVIQSTTLDSPANGVVFLFNEKHKMPLFTLFNNFNKVVSETIAAPASDGRCVMIGIGTMIDNNFTLDEKVIMSTQEIIEPNSEFIQ